VTFDPALLYEAIARREVDVIGGFSSDGRIAAHELVVLADPAGALPPYDAILLLGPRVANDTSVACALAGLRDAIDVERMRRANLMVDGEGATPAAAARWLLGELAFRDGCAVGAPAP
jgi:osmoprotectant transport system permease protein